MTNTKYKNLPKNYIAKNYNFSEINVAQFVQNAKEVTP